MDRKIIKGETYTIIATDRVTSFLELGEKVKPTHDEVAKRGNKVVTVERANGKLVNVMVSQLAPLKERTKFGFELVQSDSLEKPVALLVRLPQDHNNGCLSSPVQYMISTIYKREDGEFVLDVYSTGLCVGDLKTNAEVLFETELNDIPMQTHIVKDIPSALRIIYESAGITDGVDIGSLMIMEDIYAVLAVINQYNSGQLYAFYY